MSKMLTSQGLVLATAMAVSAGTLILFDLFRQNLFHQHPLPNQKQPLKSCLSSGGESNKKRKKRVKFAEDVRDSKGNGELYRKEYRRKIEKKSCANQVEKMAPNRAALYTGILRDRVHRVQCSY